MPSQRVPTGGPWKGSGTGGRGGAARSRGRSRGSQHPSPGSRPRPSHGSGPWSPQSAPQPGLAWRGPCRKPSQHQPALPQPPHALGRKQGQGGAPGRAGRGAGSGPRPEPRLPGRSGRGQGGVRRDSCQSAGTQTHTRQGPGRREVRLCPPLATLGACHLVRSGRLAFSDLWCSVWLAERLSHPHLHRPHLLAEPPLPTWGRGAPR